ncbi:hypothetical protein LPB67_14240 [Undibacterium sp. Jales W-56]|uniref:hypothetical protein n=1 Tax=Undibacterium sp. Jales W-56 TaxID=2897325 RepID=UPI0021D25396|nr:hypothetical protein [Undibacterium sp. Jales W-56]MCU6434933.1 hypothetical protein [Undibacterium sp. Jales W-56]
MQLRNRFYLSDIAGAEGDSRIERLTASTGWIKPLWILPRAWCVTTSIQAKGVPHHKTAALVRLHLNRLAPFADCGVYACRSGDWVHLWFWENRRVRELCAKHGLDFATLQLAPESVCFPKRQEGTVLYQCQQGIEAQLWHNGLLIDSAWWPDRINADAWQAWRPTSAAGTGARSQVASWSEMMPSYVTPVESIPPVEHARLSEPWGRNLLGVQWWHVLKDFRMDMLLAVAGGLLAGFAAYLTTQWWTLQSLQVETEKKIASLSIRVDPLNEMRSQALLRQQWVNKLVSLRNEDSIQELLKGLQSVLQQQEAALREFEYLDGEIRLMLVPVNTELNIASLTQDLEAVPKLSNLRLLPDSDARVMRISAKIQRFGKPTGELRVLGQLQKPADSAKVDQPSLINRSGKREKGE